MSERMELRLRALDAVSASSHLDPDNQLTELLERTRDLLAVDTATVLLLDPSGIDLVPTASVGLDDDIRQGLRVPVGAGFAGRVAADAAPVIIEQVDETNVVSSLPRDQHVVSLLGVPLLNRGRVLGVLHIGSKTARRFTQDDTDLLQLVAERIAIAAEARQYRLDRAATLALQRNLLPVRPAQITGLDVAARYVPGAQIGVGGDWYDLFQLPSGHIGVTIGDVTGNGLRAAVVMGRIRSALRSYALETTDPADVLSRLDRKMHFFEPDAMATVCYAVIDPDLQTVTISNAGHPPPLLSTPAQGTHPLKVVQDILIGAVLGAVRHNTRLSLPPDSCLFLYTDGLVEVRDRPITDGIALLASALTCVPAERMCATAMSTMITGPTADDIAMLALIRTDSM